MAVSEVITRLKSQLLTSGLSQKDQPLFQIINQLIDFVGKNAQDLAVTTGGGGGGGGGGLLNGDYITHENNIGSLPNSRFLVPGAGVNIHKGPQQIMIGSAPMPSLDGVEEPEIPLIIPGPQGIQGPIGPMGPPGLDALFDYYEHAPLGPFPVLLPWTSVASSDLSFSASAGTWTIGTVAYFKYAILGRFFFVKCAITGTSVSATPTELRVSLANIPITLNGNDSFGFSVYTEDGFATQDCGQAILRVSNNSLVFKTRTAAAWATTVAQTGVITNLVGEL